MTSPPMQPTIADAVRLMDSLGIASSRLVPTSSKTTARPLAASSGPSYSTKDTNGLEKHDFNTDASQRLTTSSSHSNGRDNGNTELCRIPNLPAEIIFQIASQLASPNHTHGVDLKPGAFPCKHSAHLEPPFTSSDCNLRTLLSLASVSLAFRNALAPLIWHTIVIRTPQHLPRLSTLLRNYDTLSIRSTSPSTTRRESSPECGRGGLRHPLPHIKSIITSIPDKYIDLDQSCLLALLRSMHREQLEHLRWSAEAPPSPAIWPLLADSLKSLEIDGRTFYQGHKGMGALHRLESLRMTGYECTLLPTGVVVVFQAQSLQLDEGQMIGAEVRQLSQGDDGSGSEVGKRESPLVELQKRGTSPKRQAQHLYLDPPPPQLEDRGRTAPPPPTISSSSRTRLKHLSLSTSKTSILHQSTLLAASSFAGLTCIDLYAVTLEPPLSTSLLSRASTLTHLCLVFDISGAFANYNKLWKDLTGGLTELVWLEIDPMPQQNTAPSFWDFVESCTKLEWINGRKKDSFPPCFGGFDPSHPSGALPF